MIEILQNMNRQHDFLVCIDSDGCVFDNMELKHKECFCPATVNCWELQSVSRFARQCAEFVNLYSGSRGLNRFPALVRTLELLAEHPGAVERGWKLPELEPLRQWIAATPVLSARAILQYIDEHPDAHPVLQQAARWSEEVDRNIAHIVRHVPPFPNVFRALDKLSLFADIVVVSATPHAAIVREWQEHGLLDYVTVVAGQELGTKAACIRAASGGHYEPEKVLMVGDAPGDLAAAQANQVLFCPIIPERENESWQRFADDLSDAFRSGSYAGKLADSRITEFKAALNDSPPWL